MKDNLQDNNGYNIEINNSQIGRSPEQKIEPIVKQGIISSHIDSKETIFNLDNIASGVYEPVVKENQKFNPIFYQGIVESSELNKKHFSEEITGSWVSSTSIPNVGLSLPTAKEVPALPQQNTNCVKNLEDLQSITYDTFLTLDKIEFNLENGDLINPKAEKISNDLIAGSTITVGDSLLGIVSSEMKFRKLKKKAYEELCTLRERINKAYEDCILEPYRGAPPVL